MANLELLLVGSGPKPDIGCSSPVKWVTCPEWFGASAARNLAASMATSEYLAFLDDDVVLDSQWCESALRVFQHETVGAVSGQAIVNLSRFGLGYIPREMMWVVGGTYFDETKVSEVAGAAGMNLCVRRKSFERVGGYNPLIGPKGDRPERITWNRLGAEEDDLVLKIHNLCAERVLFNPSMLVYHKLRLESLMPKGLLKRSLHVGLNRAHIHHLYPEIGSETDIRNVLALSRTVMGSALTLPRHVARNWKTVSFITLVVFGFGIGYVAGRLRFRK